VSFSNITKITSLNIFVHILIATIKIDPLPFMTDFRIKSTARDASFASVISIAAVIVDADDKASDNFLMFIPTNLLANVMIMLLELLKTLNDCSTVVSPRSLMLDHKRSSSNCSAFDRSACNNRSFAICVLL